MSIQATVTSAVLFLTIVSFSVIPCTGQVGGVWIWNTTNQYSPLTDFRNDTDRNYYTIWPEDITNPSFKFPCEDKNSKLQLEYFTTSINGGSIQTLRYYDLGIVEHYRPYWIRPKPCGSECWPWAKPAIYCEFNDIYTLHLLRTRRTIFQGVRFGVIMVLIQQIAFAVIGILIPVYFLDRTQGLYKVAPIAKDLNWGATFVEGLHLIALATAGYLLVEGYGHSGDWKISAMNTLAYYYRIQTVCAFVSSFLRQCANSKKLINDINRQASRVDSKHVEMLIGQVVVCVVMVEYLYLIDDDYLNFMIQVVFGVITVAATVSMSAVISVGGTSLWKIVKPHLKDMSTVICIGGTSLWCFVKPRLKGMITRMKSQIRKLMAKNSGAEGHQPCTPLSGTL